VKFFSASCTDVGKKRKLNEDSLLDRPDLGLWAVADGMGGHEAGEVASARIVEALGALAPVHDAATGAEQVRTALDAVNEGLLILAQSTVGERRTIGSTVSSLVIGNGRYACLWAGDSRAYRVRDKAIEQLTRDHSLVNDLVRSGLIKPEDAHSHPDANVITRAVGAARELQLDMVDGAVLPNDLFILTSDGVNRVLEDEELVHIVLSANPKQAVEQVREIVLERGAPDNLSIVIVRVY
jgi:serine/threonine-protein phosphatase Stp1